MSTQQTADSTQGLLEEKAEHVKRILSAFPRALVAFSGGVDSTLLARLAREVLGREAVLIATADSPSLAREDLQEARRLGEALDLEHLVIATEETANPDYRANTKARCYFCKQELFEELEGLARRRQIPVVLYGAIGDDQLSERPGQRAALEHGVHAPLQEAGLAKWEVRLLAKSLGLPNWDRPQNACLSSRIPHGQEVTEDKLRQIERAEALLRAQQFRQVRVRHFGLHARIEVAEEDLPRFQDPTLCRCVIESFEALGFKTVGLNPSGYQSGGADRRTVDEIPLDPKSAYLLCLEPTLRKP